jgi:hypothetical protein
MYTTVTAFQAGYSSATNDSFKIKGMADGRGTYLDHNNTNNSELKKNLSLFQQFQVWWLQNSILLPGVREVVYYASYVTNFIAMVLNFATFNVAIPGLPWYLTWIPFLMTAPVSIFIIIWLAQFFIEALQAGLSSLGGLKKLL